MPKKYDNSYQINLRKTKFPNFHFPIHTIVRSYFVEKYCEKHGDLILDPALFKFYYDNSEIFCDQCRENFAKEYDPNEIEINNLRTKFIELYHRGSSSINELYIKKYHLKIYSILKYHTANIDTTWKEKCYLFKNNLKSSPICPSCKNNCEFSNSNMRYNLYCSHHNINHYRSMEENNLFNFINEIYTGKILRNYRFERSELDIFIPDKNIAFEYNGLYWHSTINKKKKYHYDKWKKCQDRGIQLITIWEDDWKYKNELTKSLIKNKIGIINNKIGARKCEIKEISLSESKQFLDENHMQGSCISKIRLGLFYQNELISIMTFSKKRMILGNKQNSDFLICEMTRFCSKKELIVQGASSRLFNYFLKKYEPLKIISYANLDYSNGGLYNKLGFVFLSHSINYWWAKDKKYHRSNFMKHKINENNNKSESEIMKDRGFYKIYGSGNFKFEYINKEKI